jgi:hypothetical protein
MIRLELGEQCQETDIAFGRCANLIDTKIMHFRELVKDSFVRRVCFSLPSFIHFRNKSDRIPETSKDEDLQCFSSSNEELTGHVANVGGRFSS